MQDFPSGPVVKHPTFNAGTSILGQGTKIPHAAEQLKEKPVLQPQEKKNYFIKKQTINADT